MKMFKYIFIAVILVLASCQHEEVADVMVDVIFVAKSEPSTKTSLVNDYVLWDDSQTRG